MGRQAGSGGSCTEASLWSNMESVVSPHPFAAGLTVGGSSRPVWEAVDAVDMTAHILDTPAHSRSWTVG